MVSDYPHYPSISFLVCLVSWIVWTPYQFSVCGCIVNLLGSFCGRKQQCVGRAPTCMSRLCSRPGIFYCIICIHLCILFYSILFIHPQFLLYRISQREREREPPRTFHLSHLPILRYLTYTHTYKYTSLRLSISIDYQPPPPHRRILFQWRRKLQRSVSSGFDRPASSNSRTFVLRSREASPTPQNYYRPLLVCRLRRRFIPPRDIISLLPHFKKNSSIILINLWDIHTTFTLAINQKPAIQHLFNWYTTTRV